MKLSIGLLKTKLAASIYLVVGACAGIVSVRFSFRWVLTVVGSLVILLALVSQKRAYWIIIMVFLLLLGPVGALYIGGKTPNIFYEDFYLLFLLFFASIVWLQKGKTKLIVSNYLPWILVFLGTGALSLLRTPDLLRGIGFLKVYLTGFLALFLCINLVSKESDNHKIIYALPLFGAIMTGELSYNLFTAESLTKANVYISWGHSNYLATFFVFLIPITLGLLFYKEHSLPIKLYLLISLILMLIGLIATESRGALLAFCITLLIFFTMIFRKHSAKVCIALILLAVILVLHPMSRILLGRFQKLFHGTQVIQGRTYIYEIAIKTFLTRPIIGGGLGSFNYYMSKFLGRPVTTYMAHNEYLQILAEMGIIGLIAMLGFLAISYRNITKLIKLSPKDSCTHWWAVGVLAGFIGVLAHIIVEPSFFGYQFLVVFWTVMGLIYINLSMIKQEK